MSIARSTVFSAPLIGAAAAPRQARAARQRGVVLFTSLVLLVILTLVAVMLSRLQTVEERISQNDQDHQIAIQAAEATLRFAEVGLYNGTYAAFATNAGGMYTWESGTPAAYTVNNLTSAPANFLPYGGAPLNNAQNPEFLIEKMPAVALPGTSLSQQQYGSPTPPVMVFRITAYAYGGDTNATGEVQEIDWQQ
jgi:type IV pilus assembly protein PilX